MGRSESKQAFQQSSQQSAQQQANAQAALASTNKSVADYNSKLGRFMKFGSDVYGKGGEYERTNNAKATTAAAAGSRAMEGDLALHALSTGENTAGYAPAVAEERRKATQDMTGTLAGANADRLEKLASIHQYGVDASKYPAEVYSSIYGTGTGGANNAMANATSAAKTPGFWDQLAGNLVQGAAAGAAGAMAG